MPEATPYLELLPAVDIAGGQAVQLVQGVAVFKLAEGGRAPAAQAAGGHGQTGTQWNQVAAFA